MYYGQYLGSLPGEQVFAANTGGLRAYSLELHRELANSSLPRDAGSARVSTTLEIVQQTVRREVVRQLVRRPVRWRTLVHSREQLFAANECSPRTNYWRTSVRREQCSRSGQLSATDANSNSVRVANNCPPRTAVRREQLHVRVASSCPPRTVFAWRTTVRREQLSAAKNSSRGKQLSAANTYNTMQHWLATFLVRKMRKFDILGSTLSVQLSPDINIFQTNLFRPAKFRTI